MDKDKAKVKLGAGFTINLGNYESARIDAGVEIQGNRDEMPELWKKADEEITKQLDEQIEELKKNIDSKQTLLGNQKGPTFK